MRAPRSCPIRDWSWCSVPRARALRCTPFPGRRRSPARSRSRGCRPTASASRLLPSRERERRTALAALAHEPRTLVFFEAPHRILRTLADMAASSAPSAPRPWRASSPRPRDDLPRHAAGAAGARAGGGELPARRDHHRGARRQRAHGRRRWTAVTPHRGAARAGAAARRVAAIAAQLTGATRAAAYALATRGASGSGGRGTVSETRKCLAGKRAARI